MTFSPKIQNLIDSSGQEAAVSRSMQLGVLMDGITTSVKKTSPSSFAQMLKETQETNSSFGLPLISGMTTKTNKNTPVAQTNLYPYIQGTTKVSTLATKPEILDIVSKISKKYDIDEKLIQALIRQESGFKTNAVSKAGAMGLMQLMPGTAKGLGVIDPMNPVQNIDGGVRHLKGLLAKYNGNLVLALAAYNAGGGNVDKYKGVPPFKETQNYVKSILRNYLG